MKTFGEFIKEENEFVSVSGLHNGILNPRALAAMGSLHESKSSAAFQAAKAYADRLSYAQEVKGFIETLDAFDEGIKSKTIFNARFKEMYSYRFTTGLKRIWDSLTKEYDTPFRALPSDFRSDLWGHTFSNAFYKKALKNLTPYKEQMPKLYKFLEDTQPLIDAVAELKTYIKMGKAPNPNAPNAFVKPMASLEATKSAVSFLEQAVASFKLEYEADIEEYFGKVFEKIKGYTSTSQVSRTNPTEQSLVSMLFFVNHFKHTLTLRSDAEEVLAKMVKDSVRSVVEQFVAKNTSKLSLIFQKKSGITEHKILKTYIRQGTLENAMFFAFGDGSSFTIKTSVVLKFSAGGKPFFQYPTIFSNVKLADGSLMKSPSEEKMITNF